MVWLYSNLAKTQSQELQDINPTWLVLSEEEEEEEVLGVQVLGGFSDDNWCRALKYMDFLSFPSRGQSTAAAPGIRHLSTHWNALKCISKFRSKLLHGTYAA